jgi:hypothetical protein
MKSVSNVMEAFRRYSCQQANCTAQLNYWDPCAECPNGHWHALRRCPNARRPESRAEVIQRRRDEHRKRSLFVNLTKGGAGTELRKLLKKFGIADRPGCGCVSHAQNMDLRGIEWCRKNIDTIVGWMRTEAQKAKLPFTELGAKILVRRAIHNAEKAARQKPTPVRDTVK